MLERFHPQHADPDRRFPSRRHVSERRRRRHESVVAGKRLGRRLIDPTRATTQMSSRWRTPRACVPSSSATSLCRHLARHTREVTHCESCSIRCSHPCIAPASGRTRKRAAWNYAKTAGARNVTGAQASFPLAGPSRASVPSG